MAKITKEVLLKQLKEIADAGGGEEGHLEADGLLLEFIGDEEISVAFYSIERWYA